MQFYRISYVCIPYFVSVTDRREIVRDDDLSSASNSDSDLEMFSIPPLGRLSQQQRQERSSSSLSNTTKKSTQSPANEGVSNAARRRVPLRPFVFTSNGRTGIRSTNNANGLIGILQLAGAHPSRLIGTLGYHNQQTWFQANIDAIFQSDGPLGRCNRVSHLVLAWHFSMASSQAKDIYECLHSIDQTGAAHEDVPPWAQQFFRLFEAQQNLPSASAQAAETRNERRSIVTGLIG